MQVEIYMLNVGNADALIVRLTQPISRPGWEHVTVIDGGNPNDGEKVLDGLSAYTTRGVADVVVSTHPHQDHLGGLFDVVRGLGKDGIELVLVHDPRTAGDASSFRQTRRRWQNHEAIVREAESVERALEFIALLDRLGIDWMEPFVGVRAHPYLHILGPSRSDYNEALRELEQPADLLVEILLARGETLSPALDAADDPSPVNQASVIAGMEIDQRKYLFTSDAGVTALSAAAGRVDLSDLHWLQAPHHGSKRNLSSDLVRRFDPGTAYVSAKGSRKYPSQAVANALNKVDTPLYSTHDNSDVLGLFVPPKQLPGWKPAVSYGSSG